MFVLKEEEILSPGNINRGANGSMLFSPLIAGRDENVVSDEAQGRELVEFKLLLKKCFVTYR